jgi:hypothetical protein
MDICNEHAWLSLIQVESRHQRQSHNHVNDIEPTTWKIRRTHVRATLGFDVFLSKSELYCPARRLVISLGRAVSYETEVIRGKTNPRLTALKAYRRTVTVT